MPADSHVLERLIVLLLLLLAQIAMAVLADPVRPHRSGGGCGRMPHKLGLGGGGSVGAFGERLEVNKGGRAAFTAFPRQPASQPASP